MKNLNEVIDTLINNHLIINEEVDLKKLKGGTTNGVLYTLSNHKIPTYVIKQDSATNLSATHEFLETYKNIKLLPDVLYTEIHNEYIVYTYIAGETHFNRGSKTEWMTTLIKELFNQYKKVDNDTPWGRVNGTQRNSWADFNQSSLQYAYDNIGNFLPMEDHKRVKLLVNKLNLIHEQEEKYYLHGDTGVHNFVYLNHQLKGVIDPSPLIGPKIYDFTYAFCSSPDQLNLETLYSLFSLLDGHESFTRDQVLDEVLFQLYCRIGICIKVHPHDLRDYMDAWGNLRAYLPSI